MQNEEKKVKKSFFKNMKAELKKVIWPTGKQTVKSTTVTIAFVLLISLILIVLNVVFNFISTKWFDLILDRDSNQVVSDDASGDISGDVLTDEQLQQILEQLNATSEDETLEDTTLEETSDEVTAE